MIMTGTEIAAATYLGLALGGIVHWAIIWYITRNKTWGDFKKM